MIFERSQLPSGARVVTMRMPGQHSVSVGAWVPAGSRHEPAPMAGATHFLEHLLFKGTQTRSAFEIAQAFDAVGAELNAFTTAEVTCFHARTLTADLPMTIDVLADMLVRSTLTRDDVDSERGVVLEEIAMHEDAPDDLAYDLFNETVWEGHPLGRRVQGYRETVATMSRDAIAAYHAEHYRPGTMVIAAAGDVEHAVVEDLVARAFGSSSGPTGVAGRADEPPSFKATLCIRERDVEQMHLVYGTTGIARVDERRWALGILNVALGAGPSSRLFQEIRENRGLAYNVASGHQGYAETGLFTIYAGCSVENAADVLAITRDVIAQIAEEGISEEEWARGVGQLRGSLVMSLDDSPSLMSHLGKSELCTGEVLSAEEIMRRIEAVTAEDLRDTARAVLAGSAWALTAVGPPGAADLSRFVGAAA